MSEIQPTFLEFFAGAGLVRCALEPAWRCVWANDVSPKKAEVYRANFGGAGFVLEDVAKIEAESLPDATMAWASFPCQDLSLAGWRRGMSAARSGTFWAFWRLMRDRFAAGRRPPLIVVENVAGLLYGDNFRGLCEALAALGMRFGALMIDARHFVPQSRPRVFAVAAGSHIDLAGLDRGLAPGTPWFPAALRRAYEELPAALKEPWVWWNLPAPQEAPPPVASLVGGDADGTPVRDAQEVERILGMMTPLNRDRILRRMTSPGRHVGFLYRRMRDGRQRAEVRFDGLAGCLRTPEGGSSRQTVVIVGQRKVEMRLLTTREAARLMGAPEDFRLPANYNDAYRAMGDGVAVPAVRWLGERLLLKLLGAGASPEVIDAPVEGIQADGQIERIEVASEGHSEPVDSAALADPPILAVD